MTTAPATIEIPVTIKGETRTIQFRDGNGSNYYSGWIAAARIGNGAKLHRSDITAWKFDSIEEAANMGYRANMIHVVGGQVVAISLKTVIRNRQAMIVAWADEYEGTKVATAQTYYGSL